MGREQLPHGTGGARYSSGFSAPNHTASPPQTFQPLQPSPTHSNGHDHQNSVPLGDTTPSSVQSQFSGETMVGGGQILNAESGAQVHAHYTYIHNFNQPAETPVVPSPTKRFGYVLGIFGKKSRQAATTHSRLSTTSTTSTSSHGIGEDQPSFLTSNGHSPITDWEQLFQTTLPNRSHHPQLHLEISPHNSPLLPGHPWILTSSPDRLTPHENTHSSPHRGVISRGPGDYTSRQVSEAVTTHEPIVVLSTSGTVQAGTLEGLVYRLVTKCEDSGTGYRDAVLAACADLISPEHLFAILSRRFCLTRGSSYNPQDQVAAQHSILMVMMHWLWDRRCTIQTPLLMDVRGFCQFIHPTLEFSGSTGKVADILRLIEDLLKGDRHPSPSGLNMRGRSEMRPYDLAIALTLLEVDNYAALSPADYILHLKTYPDEYNPQLQGPPADDRVEAVFVTQRRIIRWVKESILHNNKIQGRAKALEFFVNTAEECRELYNFSSFIAIGSALHSGPIARLELTKAALGIQVQNQLKSLQKGIDPSSNYSHYRNLLKTVPKQRGRCVPWLAVHVNDLRRPLRENPTFENVDGKELVNFHRYVKFMDRFHEGFPHRAPDLESFRGQGQLAYLEGELHTVSSRSDDDFMQRAERLEPRKSEEYRDRLRRDTTMLIASIR